MVNYICLLSVRPCIKTCNFFKTLESENYKLLIVVDDNYYHPPTDIQVVKINNEECEMNGYKDTVMAFRNKAVSRDKALYYFKKENLEYEYVWFVEEDVFIPDILTIKHIDEKYKGGDLLCQGNAIRIDSIHTGWNWEHILSQVKIGYPYAASMICAIRCSKRLMETIDDYAKTYNTLFMDESLFNTLALQNNLETIVIDELTSIIWQKDWDISEIKRENLYHPIKSIEQQYAFREMIKN